MKYKIISVIFKSSKQLNQKWNFEFLPQTKHKNDLHNEI